MDQRRWNHTTHTDLVFVTGFHQLLRIAGCQRIQGDAIEPAILGIVGEMIHIARDDQQGMVGMARRAFARPSAAASISDHMPP